MISSISAVRSGEIVACVIGFVGLVGDPFLQQDAEDTADGWRTSRLIGLPLLPLLPLLGL
jgi:hypothetical protein